MILVFVGAGGSAAVDREQYPTTAKFFEKLPISIAEDILFKRVVERIEKTKPVGEPIDIEEMLWDLNEIQEYLRAPENPETPVGWVMQQNFLQQLPGTHNKANELLDGLSRLEEERVASLISKVNRRVHRLYATLPSDPEKISDWVDLLRELSQIDPIIEIFTTNYDQVLEYVIEQAEIRVETGLQQRLGQGELNLNHWSTIDMDFPRKCGLLTKLHGSVNWHREDKRIVFGPSTLTGRSSDRAILYPGNKGEPKEEPFQTFHEHLRAVVQKAKVALFIGFAFRDDYINDILARLPPETFRYVITASDGEPIDSRPPKNAPDSFRDSCMHNREGLTAEAVVHCLRHMRYRAV